MSSIVNLGIQLPRATAENFNRLIAGAVRVDDEDGKPELMTYHAFMYRGDNILQSLLKRVKAVDAEHTGKTCENITKFEKLIDEYDALKLVIEKIRGVIFLMLQMLGNYDEASDRKITEAKIIMSKKDAIILTLLYDKFLNKLEETFFTLSPRKKDALAHQIDDLKTLVQCFKKQPKIVEITKL